jgi:amino acid adenylation domain-containing protein
MSTQETGGLVSGFIRSATRFPSRNALVVEGAALNYATLGRAASDIAATIAARRGAGSGVLAALLAERSVTAYAGCLGILAAGRGYVPLSTKMPPARLQTMVERSGTDVLVAGQECAEALRTLLPLLDRPMLVILPDTLGPDNLAAGFPQHEFCFAGGLARGPEIPEQPRVRSDAPAYLLFTSGSTGEPKGVAVSHANVASYVRYLGESCQVDEHDRFSQEFDMTFDLSVHDMFVCWERAACLYSVPARLVMGPGRFIREHALTMWFSVPSVAGYMRKLGMLKSGSFPSLRYSFFCGEALPATLAQAWQEAAPRSVVENLYGPTEATIAITRYRWNTQASPPECVNGIVPIGWPFDAQQACIADQNGMVIQNGDAGELLLGGSQVTQGYWNDPDKTARQFVKLPGSAATWYRTGDLARRTPSGCLVFLGRVDHQVKLRGYRVELQEVDGVLQEYPAAHEAVAVAWPVHEGIAEGLVAFLGGSPDAHEADVLAFCKQRLPEYMVPRQVCKLPALPRNTNGKIDRSQLIRYLEVR